MVSQRDEKISLVGGLIAVAVINGTQRHKDTKEKG